MGHEPASTDFGHGNEILGTKELGVVRLWWRFALGMIIRAERSGAGVDVHERRRADPGCAV